MYKIKEKPEDFIVEELPGFEIKNKGIYTYFLLEKKEYNTEKVIQKLAKYFKVPRKNFGYAGSKDRQAITKQYCSVKGKIHDKDFNDFSIKIIGSGDRPISLGDLKGNKFTITIKDIKKSPEKIDFIVNYFDDQRFGKNNLEVGLCILKKDFKKAAELLELNVNNNDYISSIRTIPFKILRLIINSVQSYFWNEVASSYLKSKTNEYDEVKYSKGSFVFPKNKLNNLEIPLISFDTEFDNKEIEKLYSELLEKYNLTLRDFIIRSLPNITPMGNVRELFTDVKKLEIGELNESKIVIKFELEKGSYATVVIKKLFL